MNKTDLVKTAVLTTQRYAWEQGTCAQAFYEAGDLKIMAALAHEAVLRQAPDGRLGVVGENSAVTDPASCGEVVLRTYELTGDTLYREAAEKMLEFLMRKAPRTPEGIICHTSGFLNEGTASCQVWADSVYMAPPFLAVMGEIDEAVRQIRGYFACLRDPETHALFHIYDAGKREFVDRKLWATGSGWALLGLARVIDEALKRGKNDAAAEMKELGTDLLEAVLTFQLSDGRFHDILDDPGSFTDGAAAMMTAAFIYRGCAQGWLDEKYIPRAELVRSGMDRFVDDYGLIREVCGSPDFSHSGTSTESMAFYIMMQSWHDRYEGKKLVENGST